MSVKRYRLFTGNDGCVEDEDGGYVRYEDYEAVVKNLDDLIRQARKVVMSFEAGMDKIAEIGLR